MCIANDDQNFKCGFYPGTGSCVKTIQGKKKKKCPNNLSKESMEEKIEKAHNGHKICEGRPVKKDLIASNKK